ncbi:MAG TPA: TIGR01777 family oxidoreductase [Longimicrobiales bacterium]|nr:TIGR01777 family oxidoreductase [Longimicrobiales bacterium]
MRIGVTGSSGLIGSAIVRRLAARGDDVVRIVRPGSRSRGVYWDPNTGQIDRAALEGIDAILHLAGENIFSVWTPAQKRRILDSRVRGTGLIATTIAQLERPPRALVSASAIGYYGNRPGAEPIDEQAPKGAGFLADVVEAWEGAADPARAAGIRVAHPRMGLILAKKAGALMVAAPVFSLGLGGRIGSGKQYWSWVALADVVGSLLHLLDKPVGGPVNVVAPNAVTNAEFTRVLAKVLHRPALFAAPEFLLRWIGGPAEELVLSGARVVPRKLQESGYEFRYPELREALQAVLAGEVGS